MKKTNFLYASAIMMAMAFGVQSCSEIVDNPAPEPKDPIVEAIEKGATLNDLIANPEFVKNHTLTLPAGAKVELNETLALDAPIIITADGAPATIVAKAGFVTSSSIIFEGIDIDAAEVETPFIQLADTTLQGEEKSIGIDFINFVNSSILNLKYQFIYANKQPYLIKGIVIDNSVIGVDGSNKKTIFDFNGGGNTELLSINNSTIYSIPTIANNGGFFSSQSGKEVTDLGGETFTISITNTTLYNITNGKTVNSLRKNSQTYQKFIVKNNIVVDCGKSAQFLKGLNAGQAGKDENWDVDGNCFNFEGAVIAEQQIGTTAENIKNSIDAVVTFADAEKGDFTQSNTKAGDPRWLK